jgi:hypothetical protein
VVLNVFLPVKSIDVFSSKYLALYSQTLGDLQSTGRDLDPWVKCENHTISILMHHMHISTIKISSVMLKPTSDYQDSLDGSQIKNCTGL